MPEAPPPPPPRPDDAGVGWAVLSTLLAGIATWGAIGWLIDWGLLHTGFGLLVGMLVGFAGSMYLIIKKYV
jgi:F0F1-type ATP synthase assembly protein I